MSLLKFDEHGEPFATGAMSYAMPVGNEAEERITIYVEIEGISTTAILDTGAPYSICETEIAEKLGFNQAEAIENQEIGIRGHKVVGGIYRVSLSLLAEEGESLLLNAPVFVPNTEEQEFVPGFPPSFFGLIGCLESIRFAVDPSEQTFYFGER